MGVGGKHESQTWAVGAAQNRRRFGACAGFVRAGGAVAASADQNALPPVIVSIADGEVLFGQFSVAGAGEPGARVEVVVDGKTAVCSAEISPIGGFECPHLVSLTLGEHTLRPTEYFADGSSVAGTLLMVKETATTPPELNSPTTNNWISQNPTFSGFARELTQVSITDGNGATTCSTQSDADGIYSCTVAAPIPLGAATFTAVIPNGLGETLKSTPVTVQVVTEPQILTPQNDSTVQGSVTFTGTGVPGAALQIWNNAGLSICDTRVSLDGRFSCSTVRDFIPNQYNFAPYEYAEDSQDMSSGIVGGGISLIVKAASSPSPASTETSTPAASGPTSKPSSPSASNSSKPGSSVLVTEVDSQAGVAVATPPGYVLANTGLNGGWPPVLAAVGMLLTGLALVFMRRRRSLH